MKHNHQYFPLWVTHDVDLTVRQKTHSYVRVCSVSDFLWEPISVFPPSFLPQTEGLFFSPAEYSCRVSKCVLQMTSPLFSITKRSPLDHAKRQHFVPYVRQDGAFLWIREKMKRAYLNQGRKGWTLALFICRVNHLNKCTIGDGYTWPCKFTLTQS